MKLTFDEEQNTAFKGVNNPALKKAKMTEWLMKKGIVKSESTAQWVLLAIAVLAIVAAYIILVI